VTATSAASAPFTVTGLPGVGTVYLTAAVPAAGLRMRRRLLGTTYARFFYHLEERHGCGDLDGDAVAGRTFWNSANH